jgi:hypothetical protein
MVLSMQPFLNRWSTKMFKAGIFNLQPNQMFGAA